MIQRADEYGYLAEMRWIMSGLLLICLVPLFLVFPPLGFGSMVSTIAKARGRETKRLFSIAGFLYTLLTLVLLIAWVASLVAGYRLEISNILMTLIGLVIGFGMLIAPLIGLVIRMKHPDLFKKPVATPAAQPSNAPMTPEPEAPGQDNGLAS